MSAENVEKSLRQMERQLLQLERDLETFSSPDDQSDMFFVKMAISFFTCSFFLLQSLFTVMNQTKRKVNVEIRLLPSITVVLKKLEKEKNPQV